MNYGLNRAIGLNETGFDGPDDAAYRIQGWDFLTAGGALYNNLDFSFAAGDERGTFAYPAYTPGGGGETIRRQLGYLVDFFKGYHLARMTPLSNVIVGGDLDGGRRECWERWASNMRSTSIGAEQRKTRSRNFLDVDQPDARYFMADVVTHAVQDGWAYLKLDFTYPITTARVSYDRKKTSFESLRGLYRLFREAAGANAILSASIGEPGRFVAGYADAARLGGDASASWTGVVNNFRRLFPLWVVNGRLFEADPDVFYQRSTATQLSADERDRQTLTIGLLGGAMLTSDFPSQWTPAARKRVEEIWTELGRRPQSSQYGLYQEDGLVRAYRVTYSDELAPRHRVGLYDWSDVPQDIRASFSELGFKKTVRLRIAPGSGEDNVETDSGFLISSKQATHSLRIVALQ